MKMSDDGSVLSSTWYFLDSDRNTRGPLYFPALVQACISHQATITMVYSSPLPGTGISYTGGAWKPPSEVKELQQAILSQSQAMMTAQQQQYEGTRYEGTEETEEDRHERVAKEAFWGGSDVAVSMKSKSGSSSSAGAATGKGTKRGRERAEVKDKDKDEDKDKNEHKEKKGGGKALKKAKQKHNWVYVMGLPHDITEEEIISHFTKVGILATNAHDQSPKIKLYRKEDGTLKGDCSICYHSSDSVSLALSVLDGGYIRLNDRISVSRADFQSQSSGASKADDGTGDVDTGEHKDGGDHKGREWGSKPSASQVKVAQAAQRQALSWNEDDDGGGVRKRDLLTIVVLERAFDPLALATSSHPSKVLRDLEHKVAATCGKFGDIEKITVYSRHPDGVVIVRFHTNYAAQQCKEQLQGQVWVGESQSRAGASGGVHTLYWDGKTDYGAVTIDERDVELRQRGQEGEGSGGAAPKRDGEGQGEESYADLFDGYEDDDLPEELRLRTE